MSISVPIILRNIFKLEYPIDRVISSVVDLADEIILCADPTSIDFTVEFAREQEKRYNNIKVIESAWDLMNVSETGQELARQTNIAIGHSTCDWLFLIQADEALHEKDFGTLREYTEDTNIDAYSMLRLYFYGSIDVIRSDWTLPIIRFFRRGSRYSAGDAFNTDGGGRVENSPVNIYHYSRIGDPEIISKRILSLDSFYHPKNELLKEGQLQPYSFETYNFDCMHKENVDVGRKKVEESVFVRFTGTHPKPFKDYR